MLSCYVTWPQLLRHSHLTYIRLNMAAKVMQNHQKTVPVCSAARALRKEEFSQRNKLADSQLHTVSRSNQLICFPPTKAKTRVLNNCAKSVVSASICDFIASSYLNKLLLLRGNLLTTSTVKLAIGLLLVSASIVALEYIGCDANRFKRMSASLNNEVLQRNKSDINLTMRSCKEIQVISI